MIEKLPTPNLNSVANQGGTQELMKVTKKETILKYLLFRFIALPNAIYGDWETALYSYKFEQQAKQKDSIIKREVKQY